MKGTLLHLDFAPEDDPLEIAVDGHPAGKGVSERNRALLEAAKWSARCDIARVAYRQSLDRCRELGIDNREIATVVGKSESAIRMYFGRKRK